MDLETPSTPPGTPARRIAIVGTSGSGKTTLAKRLAVVLAATHIELDSLYWQAGWTPVGDEPFLEAVRRAVAAKSWVCDGNYPVARSIVFGRATDVVWLDLPLPRVLTRLVRRTLRRAFTGEVLYGGNRESLRKSFLSRESILLWALQTHSQYRQDYAGLPGSDHPHLRFHRLRGDPEVDAFVGALFEGALEGRPGLQRSLP